MPILISCIYQIVTEESAAIGDYAESGFEWEDSAYTFKDLVYLLERESFEPSDSGKVSAHTWLSGYGETNYRTGAETSYSWHFSRKNDPRYEKYWIKAIEYVQRKRQLRHYNLYHISTQTGG